MSRRQFKVHNLRSPLLEAFASDISARELRSYFLAIQSYAEQLASSPDLDFQHHLANIIHAEFEATHPSVRRAN